ncbi:MAG TPA: hypothetical protein VJ751_07145 [Pyrinomonadaceae bacterium]|nr:hypothetical protein [Pyrinomonadaceae bacterium]
MTLTPQQPPSSLTLSPTSTTGTGGSSFATVTITSPSSTDEVLQVTSSNPSIASVPNSVLIPAGSTTGGFNIFTTSVSVQTVVTISVSGGGVTRTATLTVNPDTPPEPITPVAPTLLSPASNAKVAQPINFDWSDVSGATSYEIQIDNSNNFTAPLTLSQKVDVSQATVTGLPAQRLYWRVRAFNSAGVAGPFSASRRFTAEAASTTTTASLSAVSVSPTSVAGGTTAQGTIKLTGGAPSGGAVVTLSSANTSVVSVPASVTVAAGASSATFGVKTSTVATNTGVTITATYGGVSRTTTLTVTPASTSSPLPAPSLVSPAADARFSPGTSITFDWTDVSGAASYTIQIDNEDSFATPQLVNLNTTASQFTTSTLPTTRMWWRVRANSASGTPGSWSSIRRFEVKQ